MSASRASGRDGEGTANPGGNGRRLEQAGRGHGDSLFGMSFLAFGLLGCLLVGQSLPHLRHLQQSGARLRILAGIRHVQARSGVAPIRFYSPHGVRAPFARLLQRGRRWDVPSTWDVSWGRVAFPSQGQIRRSGGTGRGPRVLTTMEPGEPGWLAAG
jgi:hypothetical protein